MKNVIYLHLNFNVHSKAANVVTPSPYSGWRRIYTRYISEEKETSSKSAKGSESAVFLSKLIEVTYIA